MLSDEIRAAILARQDLRATVKGKYLHFRCLRHEDREPSAWMCEGSHGCFTCDFTESITTLAPLLGISLDHTPDEYVKPERTIVATYPYVDERGVVLFEVVRFSPKTFRQRRPDGSWSLEGVRRVPYRLPELIEAVGLGKTIYVVEGEKDVAAVEAAGGVATCNPGGAGKWLPEFSEFLRDATVRIVADKDEPGEKHALAVASSLDGIAASVEIVEAKVGKDAADHLAVFALADFIVRTDDGLPFVALHGDRFEHLLREQLSPVDAVPTPFPEWNRCCRGEGGGVGLARGWHNLGAARTGVGKSILALCLAAEAMRHGETVSFISLEMSQRQVEVRLMAILSGLPVFKLEQGQYFDVATFREAARRIEAVPGRFLTNSKKMRKIEVLTDAIVRLHEKRGSRYFIVDYIQLAGNGNDPESIAMVSDAISAQAKDLNVVTFGLSQFNRSTSVLKESPTVHGLMGASSLENDSDQIVLIDHSKVQNAPDGQSWTTDLLLAKNRFGPETSIPISFSRKTLRLEERMPDQQASWRVG